MGIQLSTADYIVRQLAIVAENLLSVEDWAVLVRALRKDIRGRVIVEGGDLDFSQWLGAKVTKTVAHEQDKALILALGISETTLENIYAALGKSKKSNRVRVHRMLLVGFFGAIQCDDGAESEMARDVFVRLVLDSSMAEHLMDRGYKISPTIPLVRRQHIYEFITRVCDIESAE